MHHHRQRPSRPNVFRRAAILWIRGGLSIAVVMILGCGEDGDTDHQTTAREAAAPPEACAAHWQTEAAAGFVDLLERATASTEPVWIDFDPSDPTYVLSAGQADDGRWCVGAWSGGRAIDFAALAAQPALSTVLYGFYFGTPRTDRETGELITDTEQPDEISRWLADHGVERAVIAPVEPQGLPFEMPPLLQVQLVQHEAFHLSVQMPVWSGGEGPWPDWDDQPDRAGVRRCYGTAESVSSLFEAEREALADAAEALLDADLPAACRDAQHAVSLNRDRHRELQRLAVTVEGPGGNSLACRDAEDVWESIEGVADWVSWLPLFDAGFATREQLLRRYRAHQADAFYLTGAIRMHLARDLGSESAAALWSRMASSQSAQEGSPRALFETVVTDACGSSRSTP